jgi:DNA primase
MLARLASWDIPLDEDNEQELFLDSLDKIIAQCIEKQIEHLQAKERSVGLSVEDKMELNDLILQRP